MWFRCFPVIQEFKCEPLLSFYLSVKCGIILFQLCLVDEFFSSKLDFMAVMNGLPCLTKRWLKYRVPILWSSFWIAIATQFFNNSLLNCMKNATAVPEDHFMFLCIVLSLLMDYGSDEVAYAGGAFNLRVCRDSFNSSWPWCHGCRVMVQSCSFSCQGKIQELGYMYSSSCNPVCADLAKFCFWFCTLVTIRLSAYVFFA